MASGLAEAGKEMRELLRGVFGDQVTYDRGTMGFLGPLNRGSSSLPTIHLLFNINGVAVYDNRTTYVLGDALSGPYRTTIPYDEPLLLVGYIQSLLDKKQP